MYRRELTYLSSWVSNPRRKPIVIRGARQVGKTTLVRQFAALNNFNLIEINFEREPDQKALFKTNDPKKIMQYISVQVDQELDIARTLLFLDEVQAAPEVIPILRYFYEEMPELSVLAAGSLLEFTLADAKFSMPVGRIEYLHLGPMQFEEFLLAIGKKKLLEFIQNYSMDAQIPMPIHKQLIDLLKTYLIIGGMPEAISTFCSTGSYNDVEKVKQSILSTYQDDFSKYKTKIIHERIFRVFNKIPLMLGDKFKYSNVSRDETAVCIANALQLLCMAKVAYKVCGSSCNGLPLGAEANERLFKVIFLDVGLISTNLGLNHLTLANVDELMLINNGNVCEQFVGQHLLYSLPQYIQPSLYYWAREHKSTNAEVDYVINVDNDIIPIEVKAGKSGRMRSLHYFLAEKKCSLGLRFFSGLPAINDESGPIAGGSRIQYRLISLPLYLVGQARRLISACRT